MSPLAVSLIRRIAGFALIATLAPIVSAQVITPARRDAELEKARELLAAKPAAPTAANPFHTEAFSELLGLTARPVTPSANTPVAGPRNNRELLQHIASGLKPSGYIVLAGEPTLIFGQKRVKAGGVLTVTYEGTEYALEVTALDRTHFTLRLNRDEFTRPIK
jgi:hypothetical protein